MTPNEFIAKWRGGGVERRDAQSFFDDLCRLAGHKTPREADPDHTWFTYEYGVGKAVGGRGFADAWKKGYFGWEAKGTGKSLQNAYAQLKMYSDDLLNPPLLVVSDLETIEIHTNFTNTVKEVHRFTIDDLAAQDTLRKVRAMFHSPDELRPGTKRSDITIDAAEKFAHLAWALRGRGHPPQQVAHFLNRLVFCMFAEDIGLLPNQLFTRMVEGSQDDSDAFEANAAQLFRAMRHGGQAGFVKVDWFNGGLFDDDTTLRLERDELRVLHAACNLSWDQIDPSIFGTLFERGLDPSKRAQLGAHYTDPATITKIIRPVIIEPWLEAWNLEKTELARLMSKADVHGSRQGESPAQKGVRTKAYDTAHERFTNFLERLRVFTVLDPACGSGNFLFMSLRSLKDVEHRVMIEAQEMGLKSQLLGVGPHQIKGIELNEYAAELARITVWIGELQWMIQNGYGARKDPILRALDQIECRDALIEGEAPARWPEANVIVGNPPFIGNKKLLRELGEDYVMRLRKAYNKRISEGADFVCYWFEKALDEMQGGTAQRAGFVATNSIRGGANRQSLTRALEFTRIFDAWSDEEWWDKGTAVRVSMVCFGHSDQAPVVNGVPVGVIYADLTGPAVGVDGVDLTQAKRLPANAGVSFQGSVKVGKFDIPADTALTWMRQPNALAGANSEVLRPLFNTRDITTKPRGKWIIDFNDRSRTAAAGYELPFAYVQEHVQPVRAKNKDASRRERWWLHGRVGTEIRAAVSKLTRVIITPRVSKHRVFVWGHRKAYYDDATVTIAREDDTTMGVLHSRLHEVWALRMGTWMGVGNDPRYTPSTTFETFPFPDGLTPDLPATSYSKDARARRIADAAQQLIEARERWLNPPEWVDWVQTPEEDAAGFASRPVAKRGHEEDWKQRTLTALYNNRPAWLIEIHDTLDAAVAEAYGWHWPMDDDEILRRLFDLNASRDGKRVVLDIEEEDEVDE